jgi:tetratricopeptide (TPR) repeat protein
MTNQNIEDTSPLKTEPAVKPKRRLFLKIVIGIGIILVGLLIGSAIGYYHAIDLRQQNEAAQRILTATTHFQRALEAQAAGNLKLAQTQIEYVIQVDPNYPGAVDKLTEIMMAQGAAAIPTPEPTAAATSTPDNRGAEELFAQARQYLAESQWAAAVDTLDNLRKLSREFRAIEVDGMYYVGLRYRGMEKIYAGSLEEGIYDFALTERFGPLDWDAYTMRESARLYINGASSWGLDWGQVVDVFAQIYPAVPNLRDGSGWTATDRFRIANVKYADQLAGQGSYCDAEYYYNQAFALSDDQIVAPTATAVYDLCHPAATATTETEVVPTSGPPVATTEPPPATPETPVATVPTVDPLLTPDP